MKPLRLLPFVVLLGAHEPFDSPAEEYASCIPEPADEPPRTSSPTSLRDLVIPNDVGAPPTDAEWNDATTVSLDRPLARGCEAHLSGAWLRVRCANLTPASGAVLTGPADGVSFHADSRAMDVVVSLTRGTSRLIQLTETKHVFRRKDGQYVDVVGWQEPVLLISQQWPPGATHPTVTTDQAATPL